MEMLFALLPQLAPVSKLLENHLRSEIQEVHFKKDQVILCPGQVAKSLLFIQKGLIRSYHLRNGEEVSDWFMKEGDFCISVSSFLFQVPTKEYHVALEDCECLLISFDALEGAYRLFPQFERHGRLITNKYYAELDDRASRMRRMDSHEKYADLMENNPDFLLRISNIHMASYLDVAERTFSSIKSGYKEKIKKENKEKIPKKC